MERKKKPRARELYDVINFTYVTGSNKDGVFAERLVAVNDLLACCHVTKVLPYSCGRQILVCSSYLFSMLRFFACAFDTCRQAGKKLFDAGKYEEAIACLQLAVKKSGIPQSYTNLGTYMKPQVGLASIIDFINLCLQLSFISFLIV